MAKTCGGRGDPEGLSVKDSVVTYLRVFVISEIKCELSAVHIPWMESCNVPSELMYRLKQLTVAVSFCYFTDR